MVDNQVFDLAVNINDQPLDVSALKLNKPFSQEIFLINTYVAGLQYVRGIKKLAERLDIGQELTLIREVRNEYDDFAILVKTLEDRKIGYIPRKNNEIIARLLDSGKKMIGKVKEVRFNTDEDSAYYALTIYIDVYLIE